MKKAIVLLFFITFILITSCRSRINSGNNFVSTFSSGYVFHIREVVDSIYISDNVSFPDTLTWEVFHMNTNLGPIKIISTYHLTDSVISILRITRGVDGRYNYRYRREAR